MGPRLITASELNSMLSSLKVKVKVKVRYRQSLLIHALFVQQKVT